MYTDEEYQQSIRTNNNQPTNTMNTQYEDQNRYTAPPDNDTEETLYSTAEILAYIDSWIPARSDYYRLDEVREILDDALLNLTDEDTGINSI